MTEYNDQDRAIALIGIYQVAQQVYELATQGKTDELAYHTSINSLFVENPDSTLAVFGGVPTNIQMGIKTLLSQMGSGDQNTVRNLEVTKYVLNLMILEKKLSQMGEPLDKVFRILESAKDNRKVFGDYHENIIATIARAYKENVSTVNPRIMVNGAHGHLQNPTIANKIRALLLAGIRASLLWRQVGGSRWGLLWNRKHYLRAAQALVRTEMDPSSSNTSPYFGSKTDTTSNPLKDSKAEPEQALEKTTATDTIEEPHPNSTKASDRQTDKNSTDTVSPEPEKTSSASIIGANLDAKDDNKEQSQKDSKPASPSNASQPSDSEDKHRG